MYLSEYSFVYSHYSWLNFDRKEISACDVTYVIFPENLDLDKCPVLLTFGSIIPFNRMLPKNVFLPNHLLSWEAQWCVLTVTGNIVTETCKQ